MNCEEGRLRRLALTLDRDPVQLKTANWIFWVYHSLWIQPGLKWVSILKLTYMNQYPFLLLRLEWDFE